MFRAKGREEIHSSVHTPKDKVLNGGPFLFFIRLTCLRRPDRHHSLPINSFSQQQYHREHSTHTAQRGSSFLSFRQGFPFWGRNSRILLTSTWFPSRRKRKSACCFSRCCTLHDEIRKGKGEDGHWLSIPAFNCSGVKR